MLLLVVVLLEGKLVVLVDFQLVLVGHMLVLEVDSILFVQVLLERELAVLDIQLVVVLRVYPNTPGMDKGTIHIVDMLNRQEQVGYIPQVYKQNVQFDNMTIPYYCHYYLNRLYS